MFLRNSQIDLLVFPPGFLISGLPSGISAGDSLMKTPLYLSLMCILDDLRIEFQEIV